jgi:hypothetical protein
MSMIGYFAAVDEDTLSDLKSDTSLIEEYLYPSDGENEPPNAIDVDKCWHAIHYLLTGQALGGDEPYSLAVLGGEDLGEDLGYGPARFLTPEQVEDVAATLRTVGVNDLAARYAPEEMELAEIYPGVIWVKDSDNALEYVLENYERLVEFYSAAAQRGDGVIIWIA